MVPTHATPDSPGVSPGCKIEWRVFDGVGIALFTGLTLREFEAWAGPPGGSSAFVCVFIGPSNCRKGNQVQNSPR